MQHSMITTALELPGYTITKNLGVVRGITVRSRSIIGNIFGGLQSLFGGNISIYSDLCEQARSETFDLMFIAPWVSKSKIRSCPFCMAVITEDSPVPYR